MLSIEKTGKTVDEALQAAIRDLGADLDSVDYVVLEQGSRGFLGFGSKPAKVKVTKKFDPKEVVRNFLREVCVCMGLVVDFEFSQRDKFLDIVITGENMGILIGKRGQTLDALQYLTSLAVNKGNAPYVSVTLDAENYRARRKDTLERLARNLAKRVKRTKKEIVLEPMNPYERRIIHSSLQNDKQISTYSKGEDPYRYIVIAYKKGGQSNSEKE